MKAKAAKPKTPKKEHSLTLKVVNTHGKAVSDYSLDPYVFDGRVNQTLMHQAITAYLANQRKGLANTKTRGEVSGGGIKPWRQKGTGRARAGSTRSPLWRHGGITFGPKPHSFHKDLPRKMRTLAFKSALNAKHKANELVVLDDLKLDSHKTKGFFKILQNLHMDSTKVRFILEGIDNNVRFASANIPNVSVSRSADAHTIEVLNCKQLVVTKAALQAMEERVKKCLQ